MRHQKGAVTRGPPQIVGLSLSAAARPGWEWWVMMDGRLFLLCVGGIMLQPLWSNDRVAVLRAFLHADESF